MTSVLDRLRSALADRYRLERELGQGGMATVYLAQDLRHDRKVALKVLRPELAAVIGAERFLQEIKTTANLQHPHILPLFDSGRVDGTVFYVMPFVQGESLRDRLAREKQLPIDDAVRITREVASALDYAHRHGIIHRDIKPENILLHDGQALVADFGIALAASTAGGSRMTETGMSLGTPHYMSPEQAMGEREITPRSDVYALGCVAYEMLTGDPPFTGSTAQAIVAQVITEDPKPPTMRRRTIPAAVEDAVLTALEKLPADRFATAADFAAALADGGTAQRRKGARRTSQPADQPSSRLAVPALTAALLGGLAVWLLVPRPRVSPPPPIRFEITFDSIHPLELNCCGQIFAISPDGRTIVFQSREPGDSLWGLYARDLASPSIRPIPGSRGQPHGLFFSPDGGKIGFATGRRLVTLPLGGGTPSRVVELPDGFYGGSTWTDDGRIIFAGHGTLYAVPETGGTPEPLARPDSANRERELTAPHFVAGANAVLFSVTNHRGTPPEAGILWLTDGRRKLLGPGAAPSYVPSGKLLIVARPDGRLDARRFDPATGDTTGAAFPLAERVRLRSPVYAFAEYAASASGSIVRVPMPEERRRSVAVELVDDSGARDTLNLPIPAAHLHSPTYSPDGTRFAVLAVEAEASTLSIYVYSFAGGTALRLGPAEEEGLFDWTSDGDSLLALTDGGKLVLMPADRSGAQREVGTLGKWTGPRSLAVSGRWVVFVGTSPEGTSNDIGILSRDSVKRILVYSGTAAAELEPAVSPDGKWLAWTSVETGRMQVFVSSFPTMTRLIPVSVGEGRTPHWSGDGRTLYYVSGTRIMAATVARGSGEITARREVSAFGTQLAWNEWDIDPTRPRVAITTGESTDRRSLLVELFTLPAK